MLSEVISTLFEWALNFLCMVIVKPCEWVCGMRGHRRVKTNWGLMCQRCFKDLEER